MFFESDGTECTGVLHLLDGLEDSFIHMPFTDNRMKSITIQHLFWLKMHTPTGRERTRGNNYERRTNHSINFARNPVKQGFPSIDSHELQIHCQV